jgi:hypothetical protein
MSDKPVPAVPNRVVSLTTPAFPNSYSDPFTTEQKLSDALKNAIAAGPGQGWRVPVAIVALNPDGKRPMAHFKGNEVHYGASMIKVAALYSAFELKRTVAAVAKELGTAATKADLLEQVSDYLDPKIMEKVATISALKGIAQKHALPQYSKVFEVVPATADPGFTVKFSKAFNDHLDLMIKLSRNNHAAESIHGSGYGYLNGALSSAGFFAPGNNNGIWLAGDYAEKKYVRKYPYYRIDSVNDAAVAQATTVVAFARLYTLMFDRKLVDAAASGTMLEFLERAVDEREVWINRVTERDDAGHEWPVFGLAPAEFTVTHNKLGVGPLKAGPDVYSEASIMSHAKGRRFVVVWQNYLDTTWKAIANVVRTTIFTYLGITP